MESMGCALTAAPRHEARRAWMAVRFLTVAVFAGWAWSCAASWRIDGMRDMMGVTESAVNRDGSRSVWPNDSAQLHAEMEAAMRDMVRGGVSTVGFDQGGRPVDLWGTRFRVRLDGGFLSCVSAGPDRTFETQDDVMSSH